MCGVKQLIKFPNLHGAAVGSLGMNKLFHTIFYNVCNYLCRQVGHIIQLPNDQTAQRFSRPLQICASLGNL